MSNFIWGAASTLVVAILWYLMNNKSQMAKSLVLSGDFSTPLKITLGIILALGVGYPALAILQGDKSQFLLALSAATCVAGAVYVFGALYWECIKEEMRLEDRRAEQKRWARR